MKRTLPLVLGMLAGFYALAEFYVPAWWVRDTTTELQDWVAILGAAAYVLGAINLMQVTWPKIRRREADWPYKVVLLVSAVVMLGVGIKWHRVVARQHAIGDVLRSMDAPMFDHLPSEIVAIAAGPAGSAQVVIDAPADVMVKVGIEDPRPARDPAGAPAAFTVPPGTVPVLLSRRVAGYEDVAVQVDVALGQVATVSGDPDMLWGRKGRTYVWLYDHVFAPCNATMFALLAFFIASAAFRAFRARNVEAALLLGAAIIIMAWRAPVGRIIYSQLPDIGQWILDVPNNGSRRAIMMGAALGAISTSLRVILGLERSHLGSD